MFQKSLRIAKIARNSFSLERGTATLYGTLWWLAEQHLSDLKKARILLVGYSEINRGFAAFLLHRGIRTFHLVTKNPSDVCMEGAFVKGRDFLSRWSDFDWVVCASKSEGYLIQGQGNGRQVIFDLSVPRNADPNIEGAILWNIEKIDQVVEQNRRLAEEEIEHAEASVQEHVRRFAKLYRAKVERSGVSLALG
jgi:glutamyl-tRNA reductase